MSFDTKRAVRLALVGVAAASLAACASRPKPQPVAPSEPPAPTQPSNPYTPPAQPPVSSGVLGGV